MTALVYPAGEPIEAGDRIRYRGEDGQVEFVVPSTGYDPAYTWYAQAYPGGGVMLTTPSFGSLFLTAADIDDWLEFLGRKASP